MISRCPNCGHELERPIARGIKSCLKCRTFFEASATNRLLAAAWELRRSQIGFEQFQHLLKLTDEEAKFVYKWVVEEGYTHEEFAAKISAAED